MADVYTERPLKRMRLDLAQAEGQTTRRVERCFGRRSSSAPPTSNPHSIQHTPPVALSHAQAKLIEYLKQVPREAKIEIEKKEQETIASKIQAILDDTASLVSEVEDDVCILKNDQFPLDYFSKEAFQTQKGYHIPPVNASFSRAAWRDVAKWFDMNPEATNIGRVRIKPCDMPRCRIPLEIHKSIIGGLEDVRRFYGNPDHPLLESGLDRYFSRILEAVCNLFGGIFRDRSEVPFKSELSQGKVEHRLQAWRYINVIIAELKRDPIGGKMALKRQGQVQLEADGAVFENLEELGPVSVPLLTLMLEGVDIKIMVYHGHSRQFFTTQYERGFPPSSKPEEFAMFFKKLVEIVFATVLIGFINALTVFGKESKERAGYNGPRPSTEKWESALLHAKVALALGQRASRIMDGYMNPQEMVLQLVEADVLAQAAWERFLVAVECAPDGRKECASDKEPEEHMTLTDIVSNPKNWLRFSTA